MSTVIAARALCFSYADKPVLQDITLEVAGGEILGLVGADGSGKSTLLQLMVGQLEPDSGVLRVLGLDPADPALRPDLAYMPQGFGLYMDLTIQENLEFFADLHGMKSQVSRQKIRDLLARTGLKGFEGRRAGLLSGGMMQKLALSCALVTAPKVMFLDEPTTGVDPVSRRAFWQLLEAVRGEGVAILYATANMDEAERCDRVVMLEQGRSRRQGTPMKLVASAPGILMVVSGEDVRSRREALKALAETRFVFPVGPQLNVWLRPGISPETFRATLAAQCAGLTAELRVPTLHDAALRYLAQEQEGND